MKASMLALFLGLFPVLVAMAANEPDRLAAPKDRPIRVAVVLAERATMIDFAGPWEVFQDTAVGDRNAFELYTVAQTKAPLHTTGGANRPGMSVTPDYSFDDAPTPDLIVVGAQSVSPGLTAWLQKMHAGDTVIMSVCTGAFKVAAAGLFDGKPATTHHDFFDSFAQQFPKVQLVRDSRYVQAGPRLFSAGGLTSGIDLALHVVAEYYGENVAQQTADYMEYQSTAWKTNQRNAVP